MRVVATTSAICLCWWAACSAAGPAQPVPAEAGKTVSLRAGESAQAADGVRVGFEDVTADSRCPKGVQCVWAGDATVRIWLQQGSGPRQAHDLHTAAGAANAARAAGHQVRLVLLAPYPVASAPISRRDYVVTLMLTRGPGLDAER